MTAQDMPCMPPGKYNEWCQKRPLVCADEQQIRRAQGFWTRADLAPSERAAFFLHSLTACGGIEFVAIGNVPVQAPITLANGGLLVPCFLPELEGRDLADPLVRLTMDMHRRSRFVYDGWLAIASWDVQHVTNALQSIDQALSAFSLIARSYFEWEPKYPAPREGRSAYMFEERHFDRLGNIARALQTLQDPDRAAVYRSLGWLSQALRLDEPTARFLFCILAIEALAMYIEQHAPDTSPLAALRTARLTRSETRAVREQCIHATLSQLLEADPTKAVSTAYFDCVVGIKRRLRTHLEGLFPSDPEPVTLLFDEKVDGQALYELRHTIAHGTADALSEPQREAIRQRIWDAERIARRYILTVLEKALELPPGTKHIRASFFVGPENTIVRSEGMYQGPTHLAFIYA